MKLIKLTILFATLFLSALGAQAARLALHEGSAVWLEGDSTLHRFASTSTVLNPDIEGEWPQAVTRFSLRIPVNSLKSGKNQLDKNLVKTMKAEEHPEIKFEMTHYEAAPAAEAGAEASKFNVSLKGRLTIAGVARDIELRGLAQAAAGVLTVTGSYPMKMSDYGIEPPTMMMGTLKTKDDITVRYALKFLLN